MSSPSMTLLHSPSSPFVRKIMVLLHETGQLGRVALETVQLAPTSPSEAVNASNPAGKIPALRLADGQVLFDSRVIFDYLDQQHVGEPLIPREGSARWRRLTLAALADAILDAAVLIRYETFLRPAGKQWAEWLDGQQEKIERGLAALERDAVTELTCHFDVASIGAACALGYLDFRQPELGWRQRHPRLAAWYAEVSQRPSLKATEPPAA
ncbi:glutathione S-transferase [Zestomonas carbonaria]|uniref:Putative GST-like protein YibF n=1 Tax=Zestomonas carbonaria TaxID=2762745 RepID=A0A7U7EK94_9GAMM|nr:glutathione S-transferase N-terminal domain-containing protein [Pseudomonas carbonaria]CAD5106577.1 putative GST-like protein YibF [Pseudomonas carbonaria]